jgi:putative ABC transport system permease protein
VLQTLGYTGTLIAKLIVAEGLLLGVIGGTLGALAAVAVTMLGNFSIGADGLSINMAAGSGMLVTSLIVSASLGVLAGLVPAWQASRREITQCFRAV